MRVGTHLCYCKAASKCPEISLSTGLHSSDAIYETGSIPEKCGEVMSPHGAEGLQHPTVNFIIGPTMPFIILPVLEALLKRVAVCDICRNVCR